MKMSLNNDKENEIRVESEFNNLIISNNDSNSAIINHENCYDPYGESRKVWCKECVPHIIVTEMIEGWTSGNNDIDNFIKDTIYYAKNIFSDGYDYRPQFLEWVPFDKFTDIKQIGEGGFSKVYSTTWIDGKAKYYRQYDQYYDGSWKKLDSEPMKVALKRLNGSQNISAEYLNELKIHWDLSSLDSTSLRFYGITKDPETKELMMIMQFADKGSLRCILSSNFNNILWKDKSIFLFDLTADLKSLHGLGYSHKDFHCGNILQIYNSSQNENNSYISDFGLSSRPSNEQKSNDIYGVLPYIAPEVLNGQKYTLSSDIYSFGIIMTELSSGKPPFHKRKHDASLALDICNGLRPGFGKGTPEFYKKLAYRCMNANPDQRPTANELFDIFYFLDESFDDNDDDDYQDEEKFGYKRKEIKAIFKEADKEIPNISTSYKKDPGAIYTSRAFTFSNLSKPINSSIITSYLNDNKEVTISSSQATKEEREDYHSLECNFELSNSNKYIIMTNADYHSLECNFEPSNSNKRIIMTNADDEKEDLTVNSKK